MQSYGFSNNLIIQSSDVEAPATWGSIGVLDTPVTARPRVIVFSLKPAAVKAITCRRNMQFRIRAVGPDGRPYTNFDDR
jgi:hypothetical protein